MAAWESYLFGLRPKFQISGLLGDEHSNVNGFPEGCCLSAVAMLITAWSNTVDIEPAAADAKPAHTMECAKYGDTFEVVGNDQQQVATLLSRPPSLGLEPSV